MVSVGERCTFVLEALANSDVPGLQKIWYDS